jgi:hypothetical protein
MVMDIDNGITSSIKVCAGARCENIATKVLEVRYIQKVGHFCDSCAKDLLQSELVQIKKKGMM